MPASPAPDRPGPGPTRPRRAGRPACRGTRRRRPARVTRPASASDSRARRVARRLVIHRIDRTRARTDWSTGQPSSRAPTRSSSDTTTSVNERVPPASTVRPGWSTGSGRATPAAVRSTATTATPSSRAPVAATLTPHRHRSASAAPGGAGTEPCSLRAPSTSAIVMPRPGSSPVTPSAPATTSAVSTSPTATHQLISPRRVAGTQTSCCGPTPWSARVGAQTSSPWGFVERGRRRCDISSR